MVLSLSRHTISRTCSTRSQQVLTSSSTHTLVENNETFSHTITSPSTSLICCSSRNSNTQSNTSHSRTQLQYNKQAFTSNDFFFVACRNSMIVILPFFVVGVVKFTFQPYNKIPLGGYISVYWGSLSAALDNDWVFSNNYCRIVSGLQDAQCIIISTELRIIIYDFSKQYDPVSDGVIKFYLKVSNSNNAGNR